MMWVKPEWSKANLQGRYLFSISSDEKNKGQTDYDMALGIFNDRGTALFIKDKQGNVIITEAEKNTGKTNRWYSKKEWAHIAVSWDSTIGECRIYINGVISQTNEELSSWIPNTHNKLHVGNWCCASGRKADCTIDEFRIYKRQLTEDEIKKEMKNFFKNKKNKKKVEIKFKRVIKYV